VKEHADAASSAGSNEPAKYKGFLGKWSAEMRKRLKPAKSDK